MQSSNELPELQELRKVLEAIDRDGCRISFSEGTDDFVVVDGDGHAKLLKKLGFCIEEQKETIQFLHAQLVEKDMFIDLLKYQLRAEREKAKKEDGQHTDT